MPVQNLHIKKMRVENYKTLKGSEIELKEGLNIIIGKNGAGKSNLLDFIKRYADYFPHIVISEMDNSFPMLVTGFSISYGYFADTKKRVFSYSIERIKNLSNKKVPYTYNITVSKIDGSTEILKSEDIIITKQVGINEWNEFREIWREVFPIIGDIQTKYVSFITPENILWVSTPNKIVINRDNSISVGELSDFSFFDELQAEISFGEFGENILEEANVNPEMIKGKVSIFLSGYLDRILINNILEQYTVVKKIRFNPNVNVYVTEKEIIIENLLIDFYVDEDWLPWSYLSDGTKRMFYLISEALSINEGILLIEEPELGIHPHQLYKIMDFLKEQSRNKQIIISTHSPLVLDVLDEKELDRIIIAKYDNGTKFNHLSKEEISKAKRYINEVGELSYYWLHSDLEK